ncbi:MAG: Nramp family divalent metal transporter, partial [Bacteroidales bacterium]|nr:Nramp family divalent metal transporter [Bacteroidales bacterium]
MNFKKVIKILGPGLLYAGAAVGVSHLVQSTRAGATYGFDLIWVLIIANILKYPFFEFGPRYAIATGNSLINGYHKIGKWAIIAFFLLTLSTMFAIQAAVTIVTAGLVANIFNISIDNTILSALILGGTMLILIIGRYAILDKLIKFVIIILTISTIIAVIYALNTGYNSSPELSDSFNWFNHIDIIFLIAFIGWMPAPIDVSVWSSLWNIAKKKDIGFSPKLSETLIDFKIGYIGTAFLALGFLLLGALIMHGTGEELSPKGAVFAGQLINLYTKSIGTWAYPVIAIAALATMFSTTLTCLDAYPRVLKPTTEILFPGIKNFRKNINWLSWVWIIILVTGSLILMSYLKSSMRFMVDLATTLSFVTAPVLAFMNYKVVTDKHMPTEAKPKLWLK